MKCPKCQTDNPLDSKYCKECATPLPFDKEIPVSVTKTLETAIEELSRGTVFAGRYEIIEELGKGGMGRVYRAEDTKIRQEVALKLIAPEVASSRKTIERFRNELKTARMIAHRNVCRMFDLNEEKGTYYITMEYVPGEDLKSFIRRSRQLSMGTAIGIAKQVCEGLMEAHRLGVIHRDLKPGNIMIDKEGNARIMDFGIARSLKARGITGEGVMIGTPEYMSPEQAEAKDIDRRSDIYSLGVILYEMVTGRVPFEGDTPLAIAMKHKGEMPKSPKTLNAQISDALNQVVLKCLEKDKERRYGSAEELHRDLEKIEQGLPISERAIPKRKTFTSKEITVKFSVKKLIIPAIAFLVLIAAGIILWRILPKKGPVPPPSGNPSLAVLYFENISADPSLDDWKTGLTELLITDLSQSRYVNVLGSDRIYGLLKKLGLESAKKYSSEDLRRVAEEGRVTYTGSGTIMKAGENIIITFALRNPQTGESIPPHKLECKGEAEITSKLDDLTRLIKADLNLTSTQISSDIDKELGKITTSSPEAYRFYSEGRKVFAKGDWAQSIEFMKKAIALDPEFAMAYRSMWAAYGNMGNSVEQEKYKKKALEFSDRISDRERLQVQASTESYPERRIEISNKIIEIYPDDYMAHFGIGTVYAHGLEEPDKAIEHLEWCVKNKKEDALAVFALAQEYEKKGMYDKAKEVLEEYLKTFPDNAFIRWSLAVVHLCLRELDRALAEADRAFSLNPTDRDSISLKGDIFLCRGDLKKAEEEYRKLLKPEDLFSSINGRHKLGSLDFLQGKFEQGIGELKQALEIAQNLGDKYRQGGMQLWLTYFYLSFGHLKEALEEADKWMKIVAEWEPSWHSKCGPLLFKGLCYIQMNSLEEALKIAEEMKALNLRRREKRWYLLLIGVIELEKKNDAKAIEYLKEALSLIAHQWESGASDNAYFIEPLARAYFQSDDLENARREYEEITRLTTGRLGHWDIYARSFYMLEKIGEKQGKKSEAIANYERFLDLWKDADPGLPEVPDARGRLAALSKSKP